MVLIVVSTEIVDYSQKAVDCIWKAKAIGTCEGFSIVITFGSTKYAAELIKTYWGSRTRDFVWASKTLLFR